jgi:hypothetical protein
VLERCWARVDQHQVSLLLVRAEPEIADASAVEAGMAAG